MKNIANIDSDKSGTIMYADKAMGVGIGPGVSKLFFGNETPNNDAIPAFTVIIPTHSLLDLVNHLSESFTAEGAIKKQLTEQWQALAKKIAAENVVDVPAAKIAPKSRVRKKL